MWLSGNVPGAGGDQLDTRLRLATTVDQAIAQKIGKDSIFESLQVATEDASQLIGTCAIDDNCAYMNTISWRTPTQPLTMESEPRTLFERLFGGADATPEARARRLSDNTSILDTITADIRELGGELGASDRARVDQYMDNVRTVERQLVRGEEQRQSRNLEAPEVPVDVLGFEQQIDMMFELQALAFQGDLTRVTSYMLARELSGQTYPEFGVPDPHHPVSHHGYVPERMEQKARIDAYHMSLFEKFVNKLKSTPEGDGNLLDSIVITYGAGMSNSQVHDHMNMPVLLVGAERENSAEIGISRWAEWLRKRTFLGFRSSMKWCRFRICTWRCRIWPASRSIRSGLAKTRAPGLFFLSSTGEKHA